MRCGIRRTVIWAKSSESHLDVCEHSSSIHVFFRRVLAVHNEVLAVGRSNTFNMLFQYQQFSSSLALNQQREPKVFFDPGFQWLSVGAERMCLAAFRQGIQTLLQQVKDRYLLLTNGHTVFDGMPNNLNDDMTNTIRGHSFVKDKQFDSIKLDFLCRLVQDHNLAMVDGDGRLGWNILAVKDVLRKCGEVWKPLYHLLYVTSQISTRSVQFLEHHTSNSDRHRNIFVQGQEMILLSGYSKTTQIADKDSCTPAFINPKVGQFLFEFLAGGLRNAEVILAKVAYGDTAHHEYKT